MNRFTSIQMISILLLCVCFVSDHWGLVCAEQFPENAPLPITRAHIQQFFDNRSGTLSTSNDWRTQFLGKPVSWQGTVYKVIRRPSSHRVEILVQVLPDTLMYDTMVVLEGQTFLPGDIKNGQHIAFQGRIIHGVDLMGIKQVRVLVPNLQSIQVLDNLLPPNLGPSNPNAIPGQP